MDDSQRKLGAEFVGTFALIFFGAGSALQGADRGRPGARERPCDRPHGDRGRAHLGRALQPRGDALDARHGPHLDRPRPSATGSASSPARTAAALVLLAIFPSAVTDAANLGVPGGRRPRHQHGQCARGRDRDHVLPRLRHLRRRRRQARRVQASSPACRSASSISDQRAGGRRRSPAPRSTPRAGSARRSCRARSTTSGSGSSARPSARSSPASPTTGSCSGAHQGSSPTARPLIPCGGTALPFHHTAQPAGTVA